MTQATFVSQGNAIDYTPGSAVAAGQVVVQSTLPGFARTPIAANALGSLGVAGIYDIVKVTGAIDAGVAVYWDANGDPVRGRHGRHRRVDDHFHGQRLPRQDGAGRG